MTELLLAQAAILLLCALVEAGERLRRFDRTALVAFILLTVATRPGLADHRAAISDDILSGGHARVQHSPAAKAALAVALAPQLHHTDAVLFTLTTYHGRLLSLGLWGRVFVRDAPR
jgi:hypothetical protein